MGAACSAAGDGAGGAAMPPAGAAGDTSVSMPIQGSGAVGGAGLPASGATASGSAGATGGGGLGAAAAGASTAPTGGSAANAGAAAPSSGTGGSDPSMQCSDTPPPDQQPTCAQWAEWNVCTQDWFLSYCDASCGRCSDPGAGGAGGGVSGTGGTAGTAGGAAGSGGAAGAGSGDERFPPIVNGCDGHATRYWDCCKPHCGWSANVPGGVAPLQACSQSDGSLGGNYDAGNSCTGGDAFMCHSLAPWAQSNRLAYGFAAVAARGDICGRCYQLQFTGSSHNAAGDPGSAALAGKTMIVQATNVGGDVGSGQFDLLTPGGGVGTFNACSTQWGVSASQLGAQYGGLLTSCKQQHGNDHAALKQCVSQSCTSVFEARGLSELAAGCRWFVDWFEVADNPALEYREIACPSELTGRGMSRNSGNVGSGCSI